MWKMDEAIKQSGKYTDQEVSALEALFADSRIVEYGQNENGRYWRWASGLQICHNQVRLPEGGAGGEILSLSNVPFPAAFVSNNIDLQLTFRAGAAGYRGYADYAITPTTTTYSLRAYPTGSSAWHFVNVLAIGLWKELV